MIAFANAVKTKVSGSVTRVYKLGEVSAPPDYPYLTFAVSYDSAESYTLEARRGVGVYRVTTQAVSKTLDGAIQIDSGARSELLDERITAGSREYGPGELQVGAAVVRDPDGGAVITITSTYLFRSEE